MYVFVDVYIYVLRTSREVDICDILVRRIQRQEADESSDSEGYASADSCGDADLREIEAESRELWLLNGPGVRFEP